MSHPASDDSPSTRRPTRVGVVVNPTSGRSRQRRSGRDIVRALSAAGLDAVDLSGRTAGEALGRARTAVREGDVDVLLVAGGDGMVHLGTNACAGTDVPLAVHPQGTGNDQARAWGLPVGDLDATVAIVAAGETRQVDAARVEGHEDRPWFAGVLYGGFDSIVSERANTWHIPLGPARYVAAVLRELPVFRPISYSITVDGRQLETEAMLVAVANNAAYGGGMQIVPDARPDDGLLHVLVLHEVNRFEFLRVFPRVFRGEHVDHPAVEILTGTEVTLAADGVHVHADGEPFGTPPLTAHVVPGALTLLSPPSTS